MQFIQMKCRYAFSLQSDVILQALGTLLCNDWVKEWRGDDTAAQA